MEVGGPRGVGRTTGVYVNYTPYCVYATAFSQVGLFLDKPFPRIAFEKPNTSNCVINNELLICKQGNSFTLKKKAWQTHVRNLQRILLTVL